MIKYIFFIFIIFILIACVPDAAQEEPVKNMDDLDINSYNGSDCIDTDDRDYFNKGTIAYDGDYYYDNCAGETTLLEMICCRTPDDCGSKAYKGASTHIECDEEYGEEYICNNGACVLGICGDEVCTRKEKRGEVCFEDCTGVTGRPTPVQYNPEIPFK